MNAAVTLSATQRLSLRSAIANNPQWPALRDNLGWSLATMTVEQLRAAASSLGIDAPASEFAHKPRTHGREEVWKLETRFSQRAPDLTERQRELVAAIFLTIHQKQNSEATERQFATISAILDGKSSSSRPFKRRRRASNYTPNPAPYSEPAAPIDPHNATYSLSIPITQPKEIEPMNAPVNPNSAAQLATLIAQIAGQSINAEQVAAIVDERLGQKMLEIAAANSAPAIVKIECKGPDHVTRPIEGYAHPKFETLLRAASSRMANGYAPNIWISGPAGSGKTHAAHMVADALGLEFHFNGAISMPHELLGFVDAGGAYHSTAFRQAYEFGGVYLFDEIDGSDNSALLALNAALANGAATFPDATVKRHANCIVIAAANTWGLGATSDYVGRAKIDAAILSRFAVKIDWQYDEALEIAISGNESFARRVIAARHKAQAAGLKVIIDPRASQAGAALIAAGMSEEQAAELTYLANLTPEQRRMVA